MSLHRQYKELQSRSQKALDMMYEDLAAQQKAASASIASIESENDALWAHIEGLEEAVFVVVVPARMLLLIVVCWCVCVWRGLLHVPVHGCMEV